MRALARMRVTSSSARITCTASSSGHSATVSADQDATLRMRVRLDAQHAGMQPPHPSRARWTDHAAVKADLLGIPHAYAEDAVLEHHAERTANTGAADWRVAVGRLV